MYSLHDTVLFTDVLIFKAKVPHLKICEFVLRIFLVKRNGSTVYLNYKKDVITITTTRSNHTNYKR